ncbi:carboxypeptidase-like regulatory domain-containing protein [Shewanella acanthi]|uniref:carboxypeptidase-like regulatory domain-containing protein n=1 Tax=Shewanella acanthi TaxID=2864212 RepID=UPI001C661550|nr:carboxypeptidase-like regulatory domain-containing protein [Shewanella acanthi]QYJ77578.1 carboxypeptidase-like regulatory domain-containing protein [Shewanella acanthi]
MSIRPNHLYRPLMIASLMLPCAAFAVPVTVVVKDSGGAPIEDVTIAYGVGNNSSTWYFGSKTDAAGKTTADIPEGSYSFEARYRNSKQVRKLDTNVTLKNLVEFQTAKVTMKLSACDTGEGLANAHIRYGAGSNYSSSHWPGGNTDVNGESTAELFPGVYSFEMSLNNGINVKQNVYVDRSSPTVEWEASKVTFAHSGAISYGGSNGGSGWFSSPQYMLPSDVVFNFSNFASGPQTVSINECDFNKIAAFVSVKASEDDSEVNHGLQWYRWGSASNKHTVTVTAGKKTLLLLDPEEVNGGDVAVQVTRNNVTNTLRQNPVEESEYQFQTITAQVELRDSDGAVIGAPAKLQFYGWGSAVQTLEQAWLQGGMAQLEDLLPGKYGFVLEYNHTSDNQQQTISEGDSLVTFQTVKVQNGTFNAIRYYQNGESNNKQDFETPMQLLPGLVKFVDADGKQTSVNLKADNVTLN